MSEESNVVDIRRAAGRCRVLAFRRPVRDVPIDGEQRETVPCGGREWPRLEEVPRRRPRAATPFITARQEAEYRWSLRCTTPSGPGPGPGAA